MTDKPISSSFRDPSGFIFKKNNLFYRKVNSCYKKNYEHFLSSGLYDELSSKKLLLSHKETDAGNAGNSYKILLPQQIPFISYPYEWCFSQLKDAALLTLSIQQSALDKGMWLKDCSAFNIQFIESAPVFIDTLSFEKIENRPWPAYKQFCEHFLAPLLLSHYNSENFNELFKVYSDGIPLRLAARLLPLKSFANIGAILNIHLHHKLSSGYSMRGNTQSKSVEIKSMQRIVRNLKETIENINFKGDISIWKNYYDNNTGDEYLAQKRKIVNDFIGHVQPHNCWDFGANTGEFSNIKNEINTIALEQDHSCVEMLYAQKFKNVLPLLMDLSNPSPALGFNSTERMSLIERGSADLGLALALVHHLYIGKNIPFANQAAFFAGCCKNLIVEFVPKQDEKIQFMLKRRKDIYESYTREEFEKCFSAYFKIRKCAPIAESGRILYLMSLQ